MEGTVIISTASNVGPSRLSLKLADDGSRIINSGSQLDAREEFGRSYMFKRNIYFRVFSGISKLSIMLKTITAKQAEGNECNGRLNSLRIKKKRRKITKDFA